MEIIFSSARLIVHRKLKGMSQEKLAEAAGINIRTLQRLEKNEAIPQPHTLQRLAETLGIRIEELTCQPLEAVDNRLLSQPHLAAALGWIVPSANLFAPIVLWILRKNRSPEFDQHTRAVVNFQASWLLYLFVCLAVFFTAPEGWWLALTLLLVLLLGVGSLVLAAVSAWRVWQGKTYFYPLSIQFLK